MEHPTFYRTIQIDGLSISYREAGPKEAPTLLLLHGFPSSSRMFEPLFARLSDRYHLVAPVGSGSLLSLPAVAKTGGSDQINWRPDGLGYRARIGLLTPNDDAAPESELWTMAPEGVSVHAARVLLVNTRTFADPPHPDDAVELLAALPMQAIVFAFGTHKA